MLAIFYKTSKISKYMSRPFGSLQVSQPEIIYAKLDEPHTPDVYIAAAGLTSVLHMPLSRAIERRSYIRDDLMDVSDVMISHETAITLPEERDPKEIGGILLGLLGKYPWLQRLYPGIEAQDSIFITERDFLVWSADHVFDDFPGFFGITEREAKMVRSQIMASPDAGAEFAHDLGL
jgi:hypothetical protein